MASWIASQTARLSPINLSAFRGRDCLLLHAFFVQSVLDEAGVTYTIEREHDPRHHDVLTVTVDGLRLGFALDIHTGMHRLKQLAPDFDAVFLMYGPPDAYAEENIYPFSPPSFGWRYRQTELMPADWELYRWAQRNVRYTAAGPTLVTYLGYVRGSSPYRRDAERSLRAQGFELLDSFLPPQQFLEQVNGCRAAVGCPGLSKFWIDKTVVQLLAAGCCVLHPELSYPLPEGGLRDGVHYIRCADDYTDVGDRLAANQDRLQEIGDNAKSYFQQHLTPRSLWDYVQAVVRRKKLGGETIKLSKGALARADEIMRDMRHIDRYRRARTYAHGRVLDFGSGSGYGAGVIAGSKLVASVVGLEATQDQVRFSQANHGSDKVSFSGEAKPGHFDTEVALEVLEHLPDLEVFRRAIAAATPETVIVSFPAAKSRHIVKWHVRDVDPVEIDRLLSGYRLELSTPINDGETLFRAYQCKLQIEN